MGNVNLNFDVCRSYLLKTFSVFFFFFSIYIQGFNSCPNVTYAMQGSGLCTSNFFQPILEAENVKDSGRGTEARGGSEAALAKMVVGEASSTI